MTNAAGKKQFPGPIILCLACVALAVLLNSCPSTRGDHAVLGRWEGSFQTISFYMNGVASLNGVRCEWEPINDSAVILEVPGEGTVMIFEFEIARRDGKEIGKMGLPGFETEFTRERSGGENPDRFFPFMECAWQEGGEYEAFTFIAARTQDSPRIPLALGRDIETLIVGVVDFSFKEESSRPAKTYQEFVVAGIREVQGKEKVVFLFDELRFSLFEKERFIRSSSLPSGPRVKLLTNTLKESRYAGSCLW